jgi:outer membrane protein OmpA-like peptidoglycan-associated protein
MKRIIRRITATGITAVLAALLLTGCGAQRVEAVSKVPNIVRNFLEPKTVTRDTNYVFDIGRRGNSADPSQEFLDKYAEEAAEYGKNVSVITVDGDPRVVANIEIDEIKAGLSETARTKIIRKEAEKIKELLSNCRAETAEADVLQALNLASREVRKDDPKKCKIIICDSGISTAGHMIFGTAVLDGSVSGEEIVRNLKEMDVLPDLSSVEVVWQGAGETKAPQMKLYENNRRNVIKIWTRVLEACGAEVNEDTFDDRSSSEITDSSKYPVVTTVVAASPGDAMDVDGVTDFSELCKFKPGSPELITGEADVLKQLGKYISYMESHPDYRLLIVGTTASADTDEVLASLSKARWETIRTLLVKNGADPARIETAGLGYEPTRFCIKDTDDSGKFVEELRKKNRRVLLTSADHEEADSVRALAVS